MKDSSFIKEVVWEDDKLFVRLKSGMFYEYADVPYEVYEDFIAADSLGKFFGEHINDKYEYTPYKEVSPHPTSDNPNPDYRATTNKPKPYVKYPVDHGSDVPSAWPFPVYKKP